MGSVLGAGLVGVRLTVTCVLLCRCMENGTPTRGWVCSGGGACRSDGHVPSRFPR